MASGVYEPEQTEWIRSILQPGSKFVDVGASFGYYASLASRIVGAQGRVFAFEPSPIAYVSMREMIEENKIDNIEVYQAAAGDCNGAVSILLPPDESIHSPSIFSCDEGFLPYRVPVVRLDQHPSLLEGSPIDLVKIDVEGYEPNVVEGLRGLISLGLIRHLTCEFNSGWLRRNGGMTPAELLDIILRLGFVVLDRTKKVVGVERDGTTPYELQDVLFVHDAWQPALSDI